MKMAGSAYAHECEISKRERERVVFRTGHAPSSSDVNTVDKNALGHEQIATEKCRLAHFDSNAGKRQAFAHSLLLNV